MTDPIKDEQDALADIDEVLGPRRGPADLSQQVLRLKECLRRRAPAGSAWCRIADAVSTIQGVALDKQDLRLQSILGALRRELADGDISISVAEGAQDEETWLTALQEFPPETTASQVALLKTIERAFRFGREARVLVLVAREASTAPWKGVFGRIDLVRPGDPPPVTVLPRGNVQVIEERPPRDVLLERLARAVGGGEFVAGDIALTSHAMNTQSWRLSRNHRNAVEYGTTWPCVVLAPLDQIGGRPVIEGAIEADGLVPVFSGLDRLAWAVSGFAQSSSPGDVRPRRFQVLLWDYRGRIDQLRSGGSKLFVAVYPPGDPALRLVAVAQGARNQAPFTKDAPGNEQIDLGEPILRATVTLRRGEDVVSEHVLDRVDAGIAQLGGHHLEGEFGPEPDEETGRSTSHGVDSAASGWMTIRPLGVGGQGIALLVERATDGLRGVMKVLRERPGTNATTRSKALARFRREIQITSGTSHPFILQVLDAQPEGDEPWVVTEWMEFGSLQDHLQVLKGDVWRSLRIARDAAVALGHLHARNLVHRDVKPSNILLRNLDQPVLGDFGIVHDAEATEVTTTHEVVGTHWYRPPEAEQGRHDDPSPSFDVYSLGKVIWSMLSGGSRRFLREDFRSADHNLCHLLDGLDIDPVNRLLDSMIVQDPARRFQTASEVVAAIDAVLREFFGTGRPDQCRRCRVGTYEHLGRFLLHPSGFLVEGTRMRPIAEVCKTCGDLRLADPDIRNTWMTSRRP